MVERSGPRASLKHRLEFLAVATLLAWVKLCPFPLVESTGSAVGLAASARDGARRRIAMGNVRDSFPGRSAEERRRIVRGAFKHFGRLLFAMLKFSTMSPDAMLARVDFEGEERVRAAYARGKGVLFVTGHFGYWELQALVHALRLPPMSVMARALDNPLLHGLLERLRTRTGNSVIYRQGTMRRVLRCLHRGEGVGVLIDQHTLSPDAISIDFFGR